QIAYPRRKIEDIGLTLIRQSRAGRIGRDVRVGAAEAPTVGNLMAEINQRLAQTGHAQRLRSHPAAAHRSARRCGHSDQIDPLVTRYHAHERSPENLWSSNVLRQVPFPLAGLTLAPRYYFAFVPWMGNDCIHPPHLTPHLCTL